jgi:hypothetical protein
MLILKQTGAMVSNSQLVTTLMLTKFSDLCSLVEFRMPKRVA